MPDAGRRLAGACYDAARCLSNRHGRRSFTRKTRRARSKEESP